MNSNFLTCLEKVLNHEGGFVNDPLDPGGMTNFGITKKSYESYLGRKVTESEMRDISYDEIKLFYKKMYWDKASCDEINKGIDYCVFDSAVNSGVLRAVKWLQQSLHLADDGIIGNKTLCALKYCTEKEVINEICNLRMIYLRSLKKWGRFGNGWQKRVNDVRKDSTRMKVLG